MNKYTNKNASFTQKNAKVFSEIGLYNQLVQDYLSKNKLDSITQHTIKLFKDNAQRKRINNTQYNKAVEEFNNTHGLILLKKGVEYQPNNKYYSYINYPFIDRAAMKQTMDNYRKYVDKYNQKAETENKEIRDYNSSVVKQFLSLTETQKKRKNKFEIEHKSLFVRDYNQLVEKANQNNAIIPKRKIQKIKFQSELIFHVLIGFYISQLRARNAYLMEMNRPTSVLKNSLPKLKIDHRKLATHKIEDIPRLGICKKTAQNHVKRLREANILIGYVMINQNKPIQVNFNPQILVILDGNHPKSQFIENKSISSCFEKVLHDNSDTTRTFLLKEDKIKDCANSTVNKSGSMQEENASNSVCPADGYENTKGINTKKEQGRAEIRKILPNFLKNSNDTASVKGSKTQINQAKNFKSYLIDEKLLAEKLVAGEYDDYKGLRYDYLQKILSNPLISREEFRAVLIQDFLKFSAKIWKNHEKPPYVGEWRKTINRLKSSDLFKQKVTKTDSVVLPIESQIKRLKMYRWMLNYARKWFKNSGVNALYPYQYFDVTRKEGFEIGFYGLTAHWKKHLKYLEKKKASENDEKHAASKRKRRLTAKQKMNKAIRKYELGKFSYSQLFNYVQDNLPSEYLILLSSIVNHQNINLA